MLELMNDSKRKESNRENLFHHSMQLTTDHYDATIAYACPIEQNTSSVLWREKHREPLIDICACVCGYTHARHVLSDCIDLRRRLRRITFEFAVVDQHHSVTIQVDYIDWYAKENA